MKIAVAYENGNVFEHFGHSRQFKIYETDGQNIVKEEVIESEGSGHSAMAGLLQVLILMLLYVVVSVVVLPMH
ncbi:MAG: NifB/NifX family molybdenum-iron cluster-binding protein [Lachnospira pectinoschiza]